MFWWKERLFIYFFCILVNSLTAIFVFLHVANLQTAFVVTVFATIAIWVVFFTYTKIFPLSLLLLAVFVGTLEAFLFPKIDSYTLKLVNFLLLLITAIVWGVYRSIRKRKPEQDH